MSEPERDEGAILSEEEFKLLDLRTIALRSPYPADDPRSPLYKRVLVRPAINWRSIAVHALSLLLLQSLASGLVMRLSRSIGSLILAAVGITLLFLVLFRRRIAIGLVRIYQHFAPASIRERCMFEPSCSEYMIGVINKYGTFRGIIKGIDRLRRCNPGGGGFDYP